MTVDSLFLYDSVNVSGYTLIVSLGSPWSCAAESYVMCDVTDLPSVSPPLVKNYRYTCVCTCL